MRAPAAPAVWPIRYHPIAREEVDAIPPRERDAIDNAVDKLIALGPNLAFPHSSKVMGHQGGGLRELRPRAGRCSWRCIYCRLEDSFVILAVCGEAQHDQAAFDSGVRRAVARMSAIRP